MNRKVHMCVNIEMLLRNYKGESLGVFFFTNDGIGISDKEARKYLAVCQAEGKMVLPLGNCDNFCYEKGCQGHEEWS